MKTFVVAVVALALFPLTVVAFALAFALVTKEGRVPSCLSALATIAGSQLLRPGHRNRTSASTCVAQAWVFTSSFAT